MNTPVQPIGSPLASSSRSFSSFLRGAVLDALCCILLSVGFTLTFDQLFRFHASPLIIAVRAVLMTLLLMLLTFRIWIIPLITGLSLVFILLIGLVTGELAEWGSWFYGFWDWWLRMFPRASSYNTASNVTLVQILTQLAIVALLYFCVRCVRSVIVLGIASVAFFAIIALYGFTDYFLLSILLVLMGLLPLIARNYIPLGETNGGQAISSSLLSPQYLQALGLIVCAVCCLIGYLLLPLDTSSWKQIELEPGKTSSTPVKLPSGLQNGPFRLKGQGVGFSPDLENLGGNISMDDHTPVLRVKTDLPHPIKGAVFDEYTGSGWLRPSYTSFSLQGNEPLFNGVFGMPIIEQFSNFGQRLAYRGITEVSFLQPNDTLFQFGNLRSILPKDGSYDDLYFTTLGEIKSNRMLPEGYQYTFESYSLDFRDLSETEWQSLVPANVVDLDFQSMSELYTRLPDVPGLVFHTAERVTAGASTPYEQAKMLEEYLQNDFTYTLTPGDVPEGQDFVEHFLTTREGYCTYFATAMTVMARTLGIPSRLVAGYGLQYQDADGSWVALQSNAHAWVECYFYGVGWIAFDPTASSSYGDPNPLPLPGDVQPLPNGDGHSSFPESSGNIIQPGPDVSSPPSNLPPESSEATLPTDFPGTQSTGSESSTANSTGTDETDPSSAPSSPLEDPAEPLLTWVYIVLACVLAAATLIVLLVWRIRYGLRRFRLDTVRRKYPDTLKQAACYYTDILRQLELLGYTPKTGETLLQFLTRMADSPDIPEGDIKDAFQIVMDWKYGEHIPQAQDVERLAAIHDSVEAELREKMNTVHYFFVRVILG